MVERRRKMDDRIDNIATKVDYMCGRFDSTMTRLEQHDTALKEVRAKSDEHEKWRSNLEGRIWGIGVGCPTVIIGALKWLNLL